MSSQKKKNDSILERKCFSSMKIDKDNNIPSVVSD